jgi:small subunit ribosomal protein S4
MGLPIRHKTKAVSHKKKWDKNTIVSEAVFVTDYALKNKKEIRKAEALVSKLKTIAKNFNRTTETKTSAGAAQFVDKLKAQGYLNVEATSLDEVLEITLRELFERRLSSVVYKAGLAKTPGQARQFVVHGHVAVGGQIVTAPSYPVSVKDADIIAFVGSSSLADEAHPERNGAPEAVIVEDSTTEDEKVAEEAAEESTDEVKEE